MALRITTLTETTAPKPRSRSEWASLVDQTVAAGSAAVRGGRTAELADLFAGLAAWEDGQRAFQARKQLVELVFAAGEQLSVEGWAPLYAVTAEAVLTALDAEPSEPVLLNYAGVLLYELSELAPAEALFRAALRLDPTLPFVEKNLDAVRRRKKARQQLQLRGPVAVKARALGARARRLASQARAATGLTVSLCMIVKDEEEMLPGCLEAVRAGVDEIVIVDTGSTDRTVEIAESFGARVIDFPWNGSFADARNVGLEAATGDWILYLDADEHLVPGDELQIRELLGRTWREGFHLVETNYTGGDDSGAAVTHLALRLFRNRPEYRFEGRIHEQKTGNMPTYTAERFEATTIRIRHYGYLKSRIGAKEKSRRNIELLEQEARENPSPFNAFNLGSEYLMLGDFEQAAGYFDDAWARLRAEGGWHTVGYAPMLATRLAGARRESGRVEDARAGLEEALAVMPEHTDLHYELALCARKAGDAEEAARLARRCLELGDAPAQYAGTVGTGSFIALCLLAELESEAGRGSEAEKLYLRSLADHPDFVAPVLPLASLMLERGVAAAEVRSRLTLERPSALLLFATACYEAGHAVDAEGLFREVLERQPANGAARVGLAEALLSQSRYADAAVEAAAEPEDSALAAVAGSELLFALAAGGDADGLSDALETASARGVSAPELELYRAWQAALVGTAVPQLLSGGALAPAATALEALLRVQEFKAFGVLAGVSERIAVPVRQRRELMARMYLRRGYLESAADEWIAVAQEAPDAAAFLGLAQVALAQGLDEDARMFAGEALRLDPTDPAARRLVDGLQERAAA
jgi:tetratricopeptide (TPR) repeat protein